MKTSQILILALLVGYFFLITYRPFVSKNGPVAGIRKAYEDAKPERERENAAAVSWARTYDSLHRLAYTDPQDVLQYVHILTDSNKLWAAHRDDLLLLKGQIYCQLDSFRKVVDMVSEVRYLTNLRLMELRAEAYLKLKRYDSAYADLDSAASINHDFKWNIGNYYEVLHQKDSAVSNYQWLYQQDSLTYRYCKERLDELSKKRPHFLTQLVDKDTVRAMILMGE